MSLEACCRRIQKWVFDHILQSSRFFALIMVLVIFSFPLQVTPVVTLIQEQGEAVLNPGVNGHPEAGPWAPLDVRARGWSS